LFLLKTFNVLNGLLYANVPLKNYSLTHSHIFQLRLRNNNNRPNRLSYRRETARQLPIKHQCGFYKDVWPHK